MKISIGFSLQLQEFRTQVTNALLIPQTQKVTQRRKPIFCFQFIEQTSRVSMEIEREHLN